MTAQTDADVFMVNAALWWANNHKVPVLPLHYPVEGPGGLVCSCRKNGCASPAKHPIASLTPNGLNDASDDPEVVAGWFHRYPFANIGLRTGIAFDLLDLDGPTGFANFERLAVELGGEPQALCVVESGRLNGGKHYYVTPPGKSALSGGKRGVPEGIDVKGAGGYVVAAPSRHISGHRYTVRGRYGDPVGTVEWDRFYDRLTADDPVRKRKATPHAGPDPFASPTGKGFAAAVLERITTTMLNALPGSRWQTFATECAVDIARGTVGGTFERAAAEEAVRAAARQVGMEDEEIDRLPKLVDNILAAGVTDPIAPKPPQPGPATPIYTQEQSDAEPWPTPDPLTLKVPEFPTHVLGWMQPAVEALADELQTPVDIVAMLFLATVSATVRGRAQVTVAGRWTEPLNLYVAVIAGAGETKSPALAVISKPLRQIEADLIEAAMPAVSKNEQARRIQKSRMDKAEKAAANSDADRFAKEVDADEARRLLTEMPELSSPRLLASDATPEGLVQLLAQQRGVLAVLSAEGGLFDTLAGGRYSSGMANLDAVLQAHDGREPIIVDRKGSPPIRVERPTLTLGLAVQPQVLAAVGKSDAAVGRGFLARFLYSVPVTRVGSRRVSQPTSQTSSEDYEDVIGRINTAVGEGSEDSEDVSPRVNLKLSSSSQEVFYAYRESLEPRRHPETGDLGGIRAWANKLDGQIIRLSGLLQLIYYAKHPQNPQNPDVVDVVALNGALDLAEYLIGHAVAAHLLMQGDALAVSDTAVQLLGWIRRNRLADFTVREAHQSLRGRVDFQLAETVHLAAAVLAAAGYLRSVAVDKDGPGQPPSPRYAVNPSELQP